MSQDILPESFPDPANTRDLAKLLGIHPSVVPRLANQKDSSFPPCFRVGSGPKARLRFRRADVAAWLANQLNHG